MQVPPVYSAKYIKGKRAYEFAREGKNVTMEPAPVKIHDIQLISFESPLVTLKVNCSKGTYIRSIARDIGNDLRCGAHITSLRRTAIGDYKVENAITITDFEKSFENI
jgi:tRNA pseudouridine55 synthase